MRWRGALAGVAILGALVASAPATGDPADDTARAQSCRLLYAGTAGIHDLFPADLDMNGSQLWPEAPPGLLPDAVHLRTPLDSFNRRYQFATRGGQIYVRPVGAGPDRPWRQIPLPLCFAGKVASISADDDEMIALDTARRIFTMDNALKEPALFNWTARWGPPVWTGPGWQLPPARAWSWSVISPVEDVTWTDSAGNHPPVGSAKVSHIWSLRGDGRRLGFNDPWLPTDESYEMCGPYRGRFRSVNLSASGSTVFVIGAGGDMFTRLYDFDLSGHDKVFDSYSYEDQRGKQNPAIQLPPPQWVRQPKIPGRITSTISISKFGTAAVHRTMRVEGVDRRGRTGYWEKDITQLDPRAWHFHVTGEPLTAPLLRNVRRDTSRVGLGRAEDVRFTRRGADAAADVLNFNTYCSPARMVVRPAGARRAVELVLHNVDGLRQSARGRGLDGVPREEYGDIEVPAAVLHSTDPAVRAFVRDRLGGRRFTDVTLHVTASRLTIDDLGWTFSR